MMTYRTITTEVDVEVDLSEFDTDDLLEELKERGTDGVAFDDAETLTKAWLHDREGRKEEAYVILREYMLDKLNKVM
jgi:hypothetical protein